MPPKGNDSDATGVQRLLHILGYKHLRARLVRGSVIVESGPSDDPEQRLRLSKIGADTWRVDVASSSGRWQRTPIAGPRGNVIAELHQSLPWLLQPLR